MKNFIKIDDAKRQIIMDKTFYASSRIYGSNEYLLLQSVRRDYPDYEPVRRSIKKPDHTIERHKGLSYDFMDYYIRKYEPAESVDEILAMFKQMKVIAKAHATGSSFGTIKKWFLKRYPEIDTFNIEELTAELSVKEVA